jgi:predicted peptidase
MTLQSRILKKRVTRAVKLNYWLYLPAGYKKEDKNWPLMLFLHGAGERGDDLELVKRHGPLRVVEEGVDLPFIILSPQCPPDSWWSDHFDALEALLDRTAARFAVDTRRVYLTGLSMGGYGTWHFATVHPKRFAAIVPICGGGPWMYGFPDQASALTKVPVWAFHGLLDPVVPVTESRILVRKLRACGGNVRLTVYPDAMHDSWTRTYANLKVYNWLLQNSLP